MTLLHQVLCVKPDQADTYKCFATNEYGVAVCTATLNVVEVGFKKKGKDGTILTSDRRTSFEFSFYQTCNDLL
ncbi:hypothetical protein EYF80_067664 [Liparis tanakae]|uniref:Uncharacterized protein n=1 Tax=Liparis tanakae TaxID=230148 RepID=A0A4Z2E1G7_9TELE|nr:hypothetical protein EYF80_067664 [Liparis tanakae]